MDLQPLLVETIHIVFLIKKRMSAGVQHRTVTSSNCQKQPPEVFYKKAVLQISKYSQDITSAGVSFLIKLPVFSPATLLERGSTQVFSCWEIFKKIYSEECFWTDFRKWLFGNFFLDSRFQNHPDSVILQKYQSLSN